MAKKPHEKPRGRAAAPARRARFPRIDLNTVPSAMEQLAESWRGNR